MVNRLIYMVLSLALLSSCSAIGEKWQPVEGTLNAEKRQVFTVDKKTCFLKIKEAKLIGIKDKTARLGYYHCMQSKGWSLISGS